MAKAAPNPKTEAVDMIVVSKKAMSIDVGPAVIAGYSQYTDEEQQVKELTKGLANKRYDLLAQLTGAIAKAAQNDDNIDLETYFGGDSKAIEAMNVRIGIALGWRQAVLVGEKGAQKQKIEFTDAARKYFPAKEDTADVKQRKRTVISNFMHAVKKSAQAAAGILEKKIVVKTDKETGTLLLSGPAIKKEFGQDKVLLNEKQKVKGKGDETITLKAKPSFTQIADMGARAFGTVMNKPANNHRGRTVQTDPVKALEEVAKSVVKMVSRIDVPDEKQIKALESMKVAIDKVLAG